MLRRVYRTWLTVEMKKKKKSHNQIKLIRHIRSAGKTLEEYSVAAFQLFRPYVARILLREQKSIKERTGLSTFLMRRTLLALVLGTLEENRTVYTVERVYSSSRGSW